MPRLRNFLGFMALAALISAAIWHAFISWIEQPVVYRSAKTHKCLKVEQPPNLPPLTCTDIKDKTYVTYWVK